MTWGSNLNFKDRWAPHAPSSSFFAPLGTSAPYPSVCYGTSACTFNLEKLNYLKRDLGSLDYRNTVFERPLTTSQGQT